MQSMWLTHANLHKSEDIVKVEVMNVTSHFKNYQEIHERANE